MTDLYGCKYIRDPNARSFQIAGYLPDIQISSFKLTALMVGRLFTIWIVVFTGPIMRPLFLVKSRSLNAAANVGVLSVYPTTILYFQLFFDTEWENIHWSITVFHS